MVYKTTSLPICDPTFLNRSTFARAKDAYLWKVSLNIFLHMAYFRTCETNAIWESMLAIEDEQDAILEAARMLEEHLGLPANSATVRFHEYGEIGSQQPADAIVVVGRHQFRVEYKSQSYSGRINQAIDQLLYGGADNYRDYLPLIVVPYMGTVGREICAKEKVNWLDLSGNARIIIGQKVRIIIEGKRNKFKRPGRPKDLFAPAASRIVRWFLLHEHYRYKEHEIVSDMADNVRRFLDFNKLRQHEIADIASTSESTVSKVVNRLIREGEVARDKEGRLSVVDPDGLMESWREAYDIHKHKLVRGTMFSRSGPDLMRTLSAKLSEKSIKHAMTGLAGAWLYDHFANFRTVSLYLYDQPSEELLDDIGFKEDEKAANVWLILPNDFGVFDGERKLDGVPVVHQLQVYLDLKSHAERAEDAADHLKANQLNWSRRDGE